VSELLDRQFLFTKLLARFLQEVFSRGHACKLRETGLLWNRSSKVVGARVRFKDAVHSTPQSQYGGLHYMQLATDVDLFVWQPDSGSWDYIRDTEHSAWQSMGEFWESLDPLCKWGGRFKNPDGNHISVTYKGRA
jgi:hypothetical protein